MDNMHSSEGNLQPGIRLGLTVVLGLLGVMLLPLDDRPLLFLQGMSPGVAVLVWLLGMLAGVRVLYRAESRRFPVTLRRTWFVVLVLSALLAGLMIWRERHRVSGGGSVWEFLLFFTPAVISMLALLVASGVRWATDQAANLRRPARLLQALIHGASVALAAPLILFAARPPPATGPERGRTALLRAAFVTFLFVLVIGSPLVQMGTDWHHMVRWVGRAVMPFAAWAWAGCAFLSALSPWPDGLGSDTAAGERRSSWMGTIVLAVMVLAPFVAPRHRWDGFGYLFFLAVSLLACPWPSLILIKLLTPWPVFPRRARLAELPREAKIGPLPVLLLMALVTAPVVGYCQFALKNLFTGKLFGMRFASSWVAIQALDDTNLVSMFWRFAYMSLAVFGFVAVIRWLGRRDTRWGYWAFALPTLVLGVCLLAYLTAPFYGVLEYIRAMGFTARRISGVVYGAAGYSMVLGFLAWAAWPPGRNPGDVRHESA